MRNSGAVAVIEGAGNHCCEYMTGGIVVVLGRAGRNFGAGMSNGVAYVIDEAGTFESRVNHDMVELGDLDEQDVELLQRLIREHEEKTASPRARTHPGAVGPLLPLFRKVAPQGCGRPGGRDPGGVSAGADQRARAGAAISVIGGAGAVAAALRRGALDG